MGNGRFTFIVLTLVMIWVISGIFANLFVISTAGMVDYKSNVAIVKIRGDITTDESFDSVSSMDIVRELKEYGSLSHIKAILIEINSGGGSPVGSKEIVDEIKLLRSMNKTVVCYIRDIGASGAYWIASSTEKIYANELSLVGSIGVTGSYLDLSGLLRKYNVSYERLVAGEFKDTGSPFRSLTDDERKILQRQIDLMYEVFVRDVARNRNLSYEHVKEYSDGKVFIGLEAKKYSLIDEYGGRDKALEYIKTKISAEPIIYETQDDSGFFSYVKSFMTPSYDERLVKM